MVIFNCSILFSVLFINVNSFFINDTELYVCVDTERVDFKSSCKKSDPECIQDITYLKNFQDFDDFYIHYKGNIYHALDDVIYFQKCEKTNKIHVSATITECTKDLPVTYIDTFGSNMTGYLTQYEVIRPKVSDIKSRTKRQACSTGKEQIVYSLPNGLRTLIRIGTSLHLIPINRVGKAYEIMNTEISYFANFYKNNIQNNTDCEIAQTFIVYLCFLCFILRFCYYLLVTKCFTLFDKKATENDSVELKLDEKVEPAEVPITVDNAELIQADTPEPVVIKMNEQMPKNLYPKFSANAFSSVDLDSKSYRELQTLAVDLKIKANGTHIELLDRLKAHQQLTKHHYHC